MGKSAAADGWHDSASRKVQLKMAKTIGVLTAGGDSPGLNAAIRGVGKSAINMYNMNVLGFRDGFRGLIENRSTPLTEQELSGILTVGGTILGTSRDKPHKMAIGKKTMDMTDVIAQTYEKFHLDALVCIGGNGTQKNAYRLVEKGMNIITLPKTIDNDVLGTDVTFGFDTALGIATDAIDRLHSTAHSHHRIIVVEVMGHNAGWLALGAGVAGGADVIVIPEIPYSVEPIAESIRARSRSGRRFSIVAVSEGALSVEQANQKKELESQLNEAREKSDKETAKKFKQQLVELDKDIGNATLTLSSQLEALTGLESRVTILGYVQRGGTPSAADRLLATRLGTACSEMIHDGTTGVMVAAIGNEAKPVPLQDVIGRAKLVPTDPTCCNRFAVKRRTYQSERRTYQSATGHR